MMQYVHYNNQCRRGVMAHPFGEHETMTPEICNEGCDICKEKDNVLTEDDITAIFSEYGTQKEPFGSNF